MYFSFFVGKVICNQFCKNVPVAFILGHAESAIALTGNGGFEVPRAK